LRFKDLKITQNQTKLFSVDRVAETGKEVVRNSSSLVFVCGLPCQVKGSVRFNCKSWRQVMQVLQEIKWSRLVFIVVATVLIADTMPHPNLSPGLLESSLTWMQQGPQEDMATTALVKSR
jgi:hypothetical protein